VLSHRLFLGPQSDMDRILDAIRKVRRHVDELPRGERLAAGARV